MAVFKTAIDIAEVQIYNRNDAMGSRLVSVEVRAGQTKINGDYSGKINANTCANPPNEGTR